MHWVFVTVHRLSLVLGRGATLCCGSGSLIGFSCVEHSLYAHGLVAQGINYTEACGIFPARDRASVPHIGRQIPNHWTTREVLLQAFFPLNLFIFNLRTTTILLVSAIHQHGSAIAILMCPPLWKSFNPGILCSQSCPRNSGHNVPLSPQEDKSFFLLCHVLSLYKWQVLYLSSSEP